MPTRRALLVSSGALLAVACGRAPAARPAREAAGEPTARTVVRASLVGCYRLQSAGGAAWPTAITLFLDSVVAPGRRPGAARVLRPRLRTLPMDARVWDAWTTDSLTDTVRLSLADGMGGATAAFVPAGAAPWRGRVSVVSDRAEDPPLAGIIAVSPVPCL